ncbi:hypothetical protein Deipr_1733 [Deinococcus proteolyticus MRP]|uniref:Uncharacterized protein n=1 Tax=Deinococcus proteolyticus (strain ATCC 35074 / DSM 20540 / JCM 6276 / NBRC 101906 / NCIMB 13154 / VKM Ac-1939 / CCM 2703 / MRP) TaxID=693977 RepID=F0RL74_DEIPM|nr:hypothetical protein [Deinococcus proteolyticus]ADY26866.1 hypothetical protein Deipr_1733 [Deinococcus proteolyticus MRP]
MTAQMFTPTAKQRADALNFYFAGLVYMGMNLVLEQAFHIWSRLGNGEQSSQVMAFGFMSLLLFCFGFGLTFGARRQLIGWGYPDAGDRDFSEFDERQRLQFLEAQAKAQRFYIALAVAVGLLLIFQGHQGYSWFFAVQLASLLLALVTGLPTALMAQSERHLEEH